MHMTNSILNGMLHVVKIVCYKNDDGDDDGEDGNDNDVDANKQQNE